MDEKKIAELKATHGEALVLVTLGDVELVFKKPTRAQFTRFREGIVVNQHVAVGAQLLRDTIVHPGWTELVALLEAEPGREDELAREVVKLASSEQKLSAKKL